MDLEDVKIIPVIDNTSSGKIIGVTVIAPPGYAFDLSKTNIRGDQFRCIFQKIDQNIKRP